MKYISANPNLKTIKSKYETSNNLVKASRNTDLASYIYIIDEFLAGRNISYLPINIYFKYLEYLKEKGLDTRLVEALASIYLEEETVNPHDLVKHIPNDKEGLSFSSFKKH
mgnify:CR=1 FL=1